MLAAFDDGSPQYELFANTPREAEEWIMVLQQATYVCRYVYVHSFTAKYLHRYQHLLSRMAELRGRLLQITGEVCIVILCTLLLCALYVHAI